MYRPFLTSITHDRYSGEPIGADYVPQDDARRARLHAHWSGLGETWPIPLTPCVLPAPVPAAPARRRRTRKAA